MIPFHRPAIGEEEIEAARAVLRSGWLTSGPAVARFETAFAERLGVRHAVAVNSATAALHLGLEALGVKTGDEVVLPCYTFTATAAVVAHLGARPTLTDVGPETGLLGPSELAAVPRPRFVIPVHFAGAVADVPELRAVAPEALFLEDAAHALPSSLDGVPAGALGEAGAFSFYATKTMTTGGEGGMLVTDSDEIAARVRLMRGHGISSDSWDRYGPSGSWEYRVEEAGYKDNLSDLAAAIGEVQLRRLDELARQRAAVAGIYDRALADSDLFDVPPRREGDRHSWHLYVVRLRPDLARFRDEIVRRLSEARIGTSVHFIPLNLHPFYQRRYGYAPGDFPNAEALYARSISLPIFPELSLREVTEVWTRLLDITTELAR